MHPLKVEQKAPRFHLAVEPDNYVSGSDTCLFPHSVSCFSSSLHTSFPVHHTTQHTQEFIIAATVTLLSLFADIGLSHGFIRYPLLPKYLASSLCLHPPSGYSHRDLSINASQLAFPRRNSVSAHLVSCGLPFNFVWEIHRWIHAAIKHL